MQVLFAELPRRGLRSLGQDAPLVDQAIERPEVDIHPIPIAVRAELDVDRHDGYVVLVVKFRR